MKMDCRNNGNCKKCSFNLLDKDGKVPSENKLEMRKLYNIRFDDNVVWDGTGDYIYFMEKYCNMKGVCLKKKDV